ncbi:MAG: PHB depolymerase family esterase [Phaeodactylibacter sp.]|uniref:extracellular catalytic domain type 1 short-chain-length polyhydroxyalkanoate depolymerase n=1 Tax=Phaeodactylibacter sp. TaxID=1940289 RepID=UPI0032F00F2B
MRTLLQVTFLFLLSFQLSNAQETIIGSFSFDGQERDYRLRIPPATISGERPLVLNLHGFTSNAWQQEAYSQMNAVADTAGFYVCYPNGINNAWNVGWTFGSTADDVGFINALLDTLIANHGIDPERLYACGMSNGGFMSYRLACELNDRIAAVASVTGSMVPAYMGSCTPGRPVPVLEIHGTEDPTVPYTGQAFLAISIEELLSFWRANNECDGDPVVEELPNTNADDESTVSIIQSTGCTERGEVLHYRINNGGHTWPGAPISLGVTNQDINGSVEIWHFFRQYTRSGLSSIAAYAGPGTLDLFPNPAIERVHVSLPSSGGELSLFNIAGQLIHRQAIQHKTTELNVSFCTPGVYWVRVRQGAQVRVGQLVVQ